MNARSMSPSETAARRLAEFAAGLRYDDIPASAVERAKRCLIDAVACAVFGKRFEWSKIILMQTGLEQGSSLLPLPGHNRATALRETALAWGVLAHAFELDSLRKPGAGVHPGATVALPALATAWALGASGKDLLRAIVAGCEVMFRIGAATLHTPEKAGFHAPGLTGPFGAVVACGLLMKLEAAHLTNALGIAGSLSGGLLAFAKAESGGMVKRLHLGRAAEGGVLAAQLASAGFEGPDTVLEGQFGLLDAYCDSADPALLTRGLGERWEIETLCLKPYACHVTAQAPVSLLRGLVQRHRFAGEAIAELRLGVSDKVLSHHAIRSPADLMQAQYSVPYMTATAAFRDIADPAIVSPDILTDVAISNMAQRIIVERRANGVATGWGAELAIKLHDGRSFTTSAESFEGSPDDPMSAERLRDKFLSLAGGSVAASHASVILEQIQTFDVIPAF